MADNKTILTRIVNKHASLTDWNNSDLVLKDGEIALAYVETLGTDGTIVPTYFMKVGHGNKKFSELKYVAAPASDVYAWAKKENLAVADLPAAFTGRVDTAEANITNLQTAVNDLTTGNSSVAKQIEAAINALDVTDSAVTKQFVTAVAEANGKISVTRRALAADDIPAVTTAKISDFTSAVNDLILVEKNRATAAEEALDARIDALETFKNTTVPNTYAAKSDLEDVASDLNQLSTDFTTLSGTVIVNIEEDIAEEISAREAGDAALETKINSKASQSDFNALKGRVDTFLAAGTEGLDATLDTLAEIQKVIKDDVADAAALSETVGGHTTAIENLQAADTALDGRIDTLEAAKHTHTNKTVLDGITSTKIDNWDAAVTAKHSHSNKSVIDGITAAKVTAWDSALDDAKAYANGLAKNYDTAGSAASAEANAKAYADGLAENYDAAGAAATALTNAKAYADGLATNYDAAGAAEDALTSAKAYTDAEVKKVSDKLPNYVPTTRTVNGKALSSNITLGYGDVGADASGAAASALTSAKSYTDTEIGDAVDTVTAAYQAADSGLSTRITNIENAYVKHSVTNIEYILDCGGCAAR